MQHFQPNSDKIISCVTDLRNCTPYRVQNKHSNLVGHLYHIAFNHSICRCTVKLMCPTKLILIGQIVKLVGKWPMVDCYFVLCCIT